jgi:predicted metal-dependent phosphoesterase TrpH
MKEDIKNGLIIALIVIIGLFGIFGGKAVKKFQQEISGLKYNKTSLQTQIALREDKIKVVEGKFEAQERRSDSLDKVVAKKDKIIAGISQDLNEALSQLNGITADSSYQFLQKVAYNYPGALKFLFNELQIKYIHTDYLIARSSEKIIPVYKEAIATCKLNLSEKDSIEAGLKTVIGLQKENIADCQKINQDNDKIIKDTERQRDKEKHRKNFWRFATSVTTITTIIFAIL